MMADITLENVSVEFPIFNANGRSLTSRILEVATGGKLDRDPDGRVVVQALEDLSMTIESGERVAIIGHNGAGKSTLLRTLNRVYVPTSGRAMVNGSVASLIDINLGINPEATGRENIHVRAALLGFSKKDISQKIAEIIEFSELGDFIEMPVRTYSTGMNLRLAFAVSTIVRPEILLMDEWLSVGDEEFTNKAEARLMELVDATKILVIASHSRELIEKVCNRVIWLERGRVVMDGPTEKVVSAYFGK